MVSRILPLRPFKEDFARRSEQVEFRTDRGGHRARVDCLGLEAYARSGRSEGESRTHLSANFYSLIARVISQGYGQKSRRELNA